MKRLLLVLGLASPLAGEPKLSPDAQTKLDTNGLVIVDKPLSQAFSAYIDAQEPVFVTSDSLLMAYHRVFEELVAELEIGQLIQFRILWSELWKSLPATAGDGADDAAKEGLRRARLLVATAQRLLDGEMPQGLNEAEVSAVTEEVRRVERGEGIAAPPWILANPSTHDAVSYAAFLPDGPSKGDEILERHHRFRKWLQEMQVTFQDETTASMLAVLGMSIGTMDSDHLEVLEGLGIAGDLESGILYRLAKDYGSRSSSDSIPELREKLGKRYGDTPRWRLLATLVPEGSTITQRILDARRDQIPTIPLAIGNALGSSSAARLMDAELARATAGEDFHLDDEFRQRGLIHYFQALRALNGEPDDRVPPVIRSEAWRRKQLNATLGSWAEYRYAVGLAARENLSFFGLTEQEPGFVEPLPAFYRQLGESAEKLLEWRRSQLRPLTTQGAWILRLQGAARIMRQIEKEEKPKGPSRYEGRLRPFWSIVSKLFEGPGVFFGYPPFHADSPEGCGRVAGRIESFTASWWAGDAESIRRLDNALGRTPDPLGPRLARLAGVCFRLEAMAERQLAGRPWLEIDEEFLKDYGATLGWLMFYEGNSYLSPRDDAPRIARYATVLGEGGSTRMYQAATARPRLLYIRYPNAKGQEILCEGAVYSFRTVDSDHSFTLEEWQAAAKDSKWPEWMSSIVGSPVLPAGKAR